MNNQCGICKRVCPICSINLKEQFSIKYYALKNKNKKLKQLSSSGGGFAALAKYILKNEHDIELNVDILLYSKLINDENNKVSGMYKDENLVQYMHDYTLSIFSKNKPLSYQINNAKKDVQDGNIFDKDYIGMSMDSAISYNIGSLKPGEEKEIEIIITMHSNKEFTQEKVM